MRVFAIIVSIGFLVAAAASAESANAASPPSPPPNLALVVGCTKYQNPNIPSLDGPGNDAVLFHRLLVTTFKFNEENIIDLSGWPDDQSKRPTRANIATAFERLIQRSAPGSQVVILVIGIGSVVNLCLLESESFYSWYSLLVLFL